MSRDATAGIGGSDIGKVIGVSPWGGPLDVYLSATGQAPPFAGNLATRAGSALEPVIAQSYTEETGIALDPGRSRVHPRRQWQRGTTDREAPSAGLLIEIKTGNLRTAHRWGEPGTDEIPEEYLAQCHWYLGLAPEASRCDVPVLLGGSELRIYRVDRDLELEAALVERAERFWVDHVLARVPPPVDASETAREWLRRQYPRVARPELLESNPEVDSVALELRAARETIKRAERVEALARNRLMDVIGGARGVRGSWGQVRWADRKSPARVEWETLARKLGATEEQIEAHKSRKDSTRVFQAHFSEED